MSTITRYISLDETDLHLAEGWAVSPLSGHHARFALATKEENVTERTGTDRRREFLREVEQIVCQDRNRDYSDAEDNFSDIAAALNIMLPFDVNEEWTPRKVAVFNIVQKMCRMKTSPHLPDHWADVAGYAACGGGILKAEAEE